MGKRRNACRILAGKSEVKRALGKQKCSWVDNIKANLRSGMRVVCNGLIWLRTDTSGRLF
jgi:hypothetical protein